MAATGVCRSCETLEKNSSRLRSLPVLPAGILALTSPAFQLAILLLREAVHSGRCIHTIHPTISLPLSHVTT
jgi:hypothetical protein